MTASKNLTGFPQIQKIFGWPGKSYAQIVCKNVQVGILHTSICIKTHNVYNSCFPEDNSNHFDAL